MKFLPCTNRGVTLIELILVVAVVSAIGSLGMVGVTGVRESARETKLQNDVASINSAIQIFRANGGSLDESTHQLILESMKSPATAARSFGLRGGTVDRRTIAEPLAAGEVAGTKLRATWNAASLSFTTTRSGAGTGQFLLDEARSASSPTAVARSEVVRVSQESSWIWDHSAAAEAAPMTQITPLINLNIAAATAAQSQGFNTGIFQPDPAGDGRIDVSYLFAEQRDKSRLALVSLEGMGSDVFNLDTAEGVKAFMLEAMRRVIQGDRGQTIIDASQNTVGFNKTYQFRPGDTLFAIMIPNASFQTAYDHVAGGGFDLDKYPLATLQRNDGTAPFKANQFASLGRGSGAFAVEDRVVGIAHPRDIDYQDLIFKVIGLVEVPGSNPLTFDPAEKYRGDNSWNTGNPTLRQALIDAGIIPANTPI